MSLIETGWTQGAWLQTETVSTINFYPTNAMNSWTGYGKLELGVARGLSARGIGLNVVPDVDAPTLVIGFAGWLDAPHIAQTRKWILTQCESDKVSQKWVDLINWHAEGVLVTSEAHVNIFKNSGVIVPVHYVGHGIDLRVPVRSTGWDGESRFEWLTYSYGDMRKGAELAIMAFKRLFGNDEGHRLTIKARDGRGVTWIEGLDDPQIDVVFGQQSEYEWMQMIARSHAFLFPSRAEGFGMPPREATLAGVPTIATQWLGMADVDQWGYPINVKEMRPAQYDQWEANARGSLWAEPDQAHLELQMMEIVQSYEQSRQVAMQGRRYLLQNNAWDVVAGRILEAMS